MNSNYLLSEFISAHDEYRRLVWEYNNAMEAYQDDPSMIIFQNLQEAIQRLKGQQQIIDLNRMMLTL